MILFIDKSQNRDKISAMTICNQSSTITIDPAAFVSVPDAARFLGVHKTTIYRRIERGVMVALEIAGYLCVPKSEVRRLIEKGCHNCSHFIGGFCGCREAEDVVSPCPDWYKDF